MSLLRLSVVFALFCCITAVSAQSLSQKELESRISDISAMLHVKEKTRTDLNTELKAVKESLRINSAENTDLSIQVKQLQLQERKITLMSDKSEAEQSEELSKLQYRIRIAEIAQRKNRQEVKALSRRKRELIQRLERLDLILATKHEQLEHLKSQRKLVKKDQQRQQQLAEIQRRALQEQRLQAQLKKQQQQTAEARIKTIENEYNEKLRQERLRREREMQAIRNQNLPPHIAAFSMAKLIAQEPLDGQPALGATPKFSVSRPVSSPARHLTDLKHLGNNQYFARINVRKGRQVFLIEQQRFTKVISPSFDKKECLVLVDARNDQVNLQLYPVE